jgi:hypothetical protein
MNSRQRRKAEAKAHNEARDNARVLDEDGLLNVEPDRMSRKSVRMRLTSLDKVALLMTTGVIFK